MTKTRPLKTHPSPTKLHHSAPASLRTPAEAREWLGYVGISVAQWARDHQFSEQLVREVLAGRKRCLRGQCHNIAVALGLKRGVPTTSPGRAPRSAIAEGAAA